MRKKIGAGKAKAHRTKSFEKKHGITQAHKDFVKKGAGKRRKALRTEVRDMRKVQKRK
jgi:hypothetical protein